MNDLLSQLPHDTTVVTIPIDRESLPQYAAVIFKFNSATPPKPSAPRPGAPGIDVSKWQPNVDWGKVKGAGKEFVIVKATQGLVNFDPLYAQHMAGAEAAGLLRGAYHYFDPRFDALKQAAHFVATIGQDDFAAGLWCDVEYEAWMGAVNAHANTLNVLLWLAEVKRLTGKLVGLYTRASLFSPANAPAYVLEPNNHLATYPLWVANYTSAPAPKLPPGFDTWRMWQYSATGKVDGITNADGTLADVDLNRWQ